MSTPLSPRWVSERHEEFRNDRAARVIGNAVATTDVRTLSLDRAILTSIDSSVSDLIPDAQITDQKKSGRCWAFAGLNVLRAAIIKELSLETFEFSQSFIYFHDKLEKAHAFLTQVVADAQAGADLMDREVTASFEQPIFDGGYWSEFARLVAKYGVVPHYAMPDSFSATSSDAMNDSLSTILRRGGLRLRAAVAAGESTEAIHEALMRDVHRLLSIHLGTPPESFMWQYRDKDKNFHRVGEMTPQEFQQRYAAHVTNFVTVAHDPRPEITLHHLYGFERGELMVGEGPQEHVTVTMAEMKAECIRAIQAGIPVWFACDVAKHNDKETGVWDAALHDYEGLYGVEMAMTKHERLISRESMLTHAMCVTGVDLVDGVPRRWRVENSWGDKYGEKGFWTMNDSWFDEYVFQAVIPLDGADKAIVAALDAEPTLLPWWDPMN